MKKSIVLAILGIAAAAVPSYGQGSVVFKNYFVSSSPTINFSATGVTPASKEGLAIGSAFTAELLWFNGVTANPASLTLAAGSLTPFATPGCIDGDVANFAGLFIGGVVTLPGYSSGLATFQVAVFGTEGANSYAGESGLFTMTPATGASPPPGFNQVQVGVGSVQYDAGSYDSGANGGQPIRPIPEPTTMALAALGGLSLLLFRRKMA
jgi:hypothetical protein